MAQVVVTHWVHPEVVSYLARFAEPRVPARDEGVWPAARLAELAATADGLITCMADAHRAHRRTRRRADPRPDPAARPG